MVFVSVDFRFFKRALLVSSFVLFVFFCVLFSFPFVFRFFPAFRAVLSSRRARVFLSCFLLRFFLPRLFYGRRREDKCAF